MLVAVARAQFVQTGPGTYEYLSVLNWLGSLTGNINGQFTQTQTGAQTLTFTLDTTLSSGFTFNLGAPNSSLTLRSLGLADRTLTFGGDIAMASAYGTGVQIGDPTANNRLNLALTSGAHVLTLAANNSLSLVNTVSNAGGAASLDKRGDGFLFLSGANTYSGGTVIEAGSVFATNATGSATGTGNITIASGAQLAIGKDPAAALGAVSGNIASDGAVIFSRGDATTYAGKITGAGSVTQSGQGTLTLTGVSTYTGGTTVNNGTLVIGADQALPAGGNLLVDTNGALGVAHDQSVGTLQGSGAINLAAAHALSVDNGYFSGVISGDGKFVKTGGTDDYLTLTGANTYTGGTAVNGGSLTIEGDENLGAGSGGLSFDGGRLAFQEGGATARAITLNAGGGTISTGGVPVTLSGVISGPGALELHGTGDVTLSGNNTYSGGTLVSYGTTVAVASDANLGATAGGLVLTGGTLRTTAAIADFTHGIEFRDSDGTIDTFGYNSTVSGALTGTAGFTKVGEGTLTLTNSASDFSGWTYVRLGTLRLGVDQALPATGSIQIDSGATLDVAANLTTRYLGGYGAITLQRAQTLTIATGYGGSFAGVISGYGTLALADSTYLTLSGANTYTGGTTISSGSTLQVGDGETGSLAGDVANDGQLTFYTGGTQAYGGNITGNGSVEFRGGATYTLTGASTYTGATRLSGEATTVVVAAADTLPVATSLDVSSGATLQLDQNQTVRDLNGYDSSGRVVIGAGRTLTVNPAADTQNNFGGIISGAGALVKSGGGSLFLYNDNTYTGGTAVNAGTLYIGAGNESYPGGSVQGDITVASGALVAFNHAFDSTYGGVISGDGAVRTQGFGVMSLTGANTYRGGTTIDYGSTLAITSDTALGDAAGALTLRGGTLRTDAALGTVSRGLVLTDSTGYIDTNGFDSTFSGKITGNTGFTKTGAGVLTLTNPNSDYNGWLTVSGGTLRVGADNALPAAGNTYLGSEGTLDVAHDLTLFSVSGNGTITLAATKTLTLGGGYYNTFAGPITGDGALQVAANSSLQLNSDSTYTGGTTIGPGGSLSLGYNTATGSITGDVVNNGQLSFGRVGGETFAGAISGSGQISVTQDTLTLTGNNTYAGATTVYQDATLVAGAAHALPATTNLSLYANATLQLDASQTIAQLNSWQAGAQVILGQGTVLTVEPGQNGYSGTFTGVISGGGAFVKNGTNNQTLGGDNTYTGGTTVNAGSLTIGGTGESTTGSVLGDIALANHAQLWFQRSNAYTFAGAITGSGSVSSFGNGTLTLTGQSSYDGQTQVSNGTLRVGAAGALPATTAVSVNYATFDVGYDQTIASLSGNGVLTLGSGATLTVATAAENGSYFSGNVSGAGGLVKNGPDRLVLAGRNTFTGATTINAGELQISAYATTPALTAAITDNATLTFDNAADYTYSGVLSGAGMLNKRNYGTLTLTANSPFTGSVYISNGTLQLGTGGTAGGLSTTSIELDYGGTLAINRSDSFIYPGAVTGSGSFVKDGAGTLTLVGDNSFSGSATVNGGTLIVGAVTSLPQVLVTVNSGATLDIAADTTVASLTGTGTTTVDAAHTLTLANSSVLGSVVSGAGSLGISGQVVVTADQTYTGLTKVFDGGSLTLGNGGATGSVAGDISLGCYGSWLTFARSDRYTYAGVISGLGSVSVTGPGTLTFAGLNTYSGATQINSGGLADGVAGAFSPDSVIYLGSGATLSVNYNETIPGLMDAYPGYGGDVALAGGATLTVNVADNHFYTASGAITGAGSLLKTGAGYFTLGGAAAFTGGTTVNGGFLIVGNGDFGSLAGNVTFTGTTDLYGGELQFNRNDALTFAGAIAGPGRVSNFGYGTVSFSGASTYSGGTYLYAGRFADTATNRFSPNSAFYLNSLATLAVGYNETIAGLNDYFYIPTNGGGEPGPKPTPSSGGAVTLASGATLTVAMPAGYSQFSGAISGDGALAKTGAGILALTGVNSYAGGTTIGGGSTLMLGNGGAGGSIIGNVADNGTLVFNRGDNFTFSGVISGSGGLMQGVANGPFTGTTTLTGINTYSGGTTINSGKLVAGNASAFGTGPITINGGSLGVAQGVSLSTPLTFGPAGGVLSGNGTISAPFTTGQNVTLSPGNSPGQLTFTSGLTWSSGGAYTFEIASALGTRPGTDYDTIAITGGAFAITSTTLNPFTIHVTSLDVNLAPGTVSDFSAASSYTWLLATSATSIQGFAPNLFAIDTSQFANVLGGGTFSVSLGGLNGDTSVFLNFNPASVPEPSTWALLALGLGAVVLLARRRRKQG
ncbi:MAG: autotransporter-associated beta strand repeat-containing protein [Verrucomicrobia bacterium]|nr:autotransporter-associated beta strand repeat-containing protein [Verrucomicrobiota bacterium]